MKQNNIFLNIGLNNNPYKQNKVINIIENLGLKIKANLTINSTYLSDNEPTLVIYSKSSLKLSELVQITEKLCEVLNQDCIAITHNFNELLIYNLNKDVEQIKFDSKYFKKIINSNNIKY